MGTTVLDSQVSAAPGTYVYAHCRKGQRGGVTLLVVNADRQRSLELHLPTASERYTLTANALEGTRVDLNGRPLRLTSKEDLPQLKGEAITAGRVSLAPTSITYLTVENWSNADCQ